MELAYIKSSMGLIDNEFQQAYARAFTSGAAEEVVITGLTDIGFVSWHELNINNRKRFLKLL